MLGASVGRGGERRRSAGSRRVHRPDLALMDVRIMGSVDGIQTAGLLRAAYQYRLSF